MGYTAEGDSDSDVLSATNVKFDFTVYEWGEYIDDPPYPRISGYGKDDDTNEPISVAPDEYGEFQAYLGPLAAGTYTIYAVYHDDTGYYKDATYTETITIDKASTKIRIEQDLLELDIGDKIISGAYISPSDAGRLSYSSNDTEVAEIINDTNIIVAKKAGSAIITVSFAGDDKYAATIFLETFSRFKMR